MSPRRARAVSGRVGDDPAVALREHLIDVAERLVSTTPVTAITTRDIARAADVSDGVLYNYFEDKEALIVAALERRYHTLAAAFQAGLPRPGERPIEESIGWFARAVLELAGDALPLMASLLTRPELLHRLAAVLHGRADGPQHLERLMMEYVDAERGLGRLRPETDGRAVATLIMGSMVALALSGHIAPGVAGEPPDELVAAIVRTLVEGLAGPA